MKTKTPLGASSACYTVKNYGTVEESGDKNFQRYMVVEVDAIARGVSSPETKTFVDLGAGYGRVIPEVSGRARNVIAIELNPDMFSGLKAKADAQTNVDAVFGDVLDLPEILAARDVANPVIMLLQNTLMNIGGIENANVKHELLMKMRDVAARYKGEIIISLLKQEALEKMGVPMYRTFSFAGEVDLERTDFRQGIYTSKSGYQSKWWRPEERDFIRKLFGGKIIKEYEEENFWILHTSYTD